MLENNGTCQTLCRSTVPAEDVKFINDRIKEDYALNWLVDGLPAAEMKQGAYSLFQLTQYSNHFLDLRTGDVFFDMGFNLGQDEGQFADAPALNNHYDIVLR
jgi:transmembrane 9 superfamily protein 2/4